MPRSPRSQRLPSLREIAAEIERMPDGPNKDALREHVGEVIALGRTLAEFKKVIRDAEKRKGQ